MNFGPQELIILVLVLLVVFGGSQVPKLARNLGKAQSEFKKGLSEGKGDDTAAADTKPVDTNPADTNPAETDPAEAAEPAPDAHRNGV